MDPFDKVDVTDNGEFISYKYGHSIPYEEVEELFEAGIEFTTNAAKELRKEAGEFFKTS